MAEDEKFRFRFLTRRLENKLDKMIGFFFWKTYVATTLYANISTPINLTITIFTALMTAHSSTSSSFISNEMNMKINLVTFLVSILNSYFTPQKEFNELNEYLIKWSSLGNEFEKCIYTNNSYEEKVQNYTRLLEEANNLYKDQYLKKRNFLTDLLHTFVKYVFMDSNDRWMRHGTFDFYEKINECIELDFDLDEFKYKCKKETFFEKICGCFKGCFQCCKKPIDKLSKGGRPRSVRNEYYEPKFTTKSSFSEPQSSDEVKSSIELQTLNQSTNESTNQSTNESKNQQQNELTEVNASQV